VKMKKMKLKGHYTGSLGTESLYHSKSRSFNGIGNYRLDMEEDNHGDIESLTWDLVYTINNRDWVVEVAYCEQI
jgi:hypothetical protein